MNTFEFILVFTCLAGVLSLFYSLMSDHQHRMAATQGLLDEKWFILSCSLWADDASTHYAVVPSHSCVTYSFSLHSPSNSLSTILGRDANHYG